MFDTPIWKRINSGQLDPSLLVGMCQVHLAPYRERSGLTALTGQGTVRAVSNSKGQVMTANAARKVVTAPLRQVENMTDVFFSTEDVWLRMPTALARMLFPNASTERNRIIVMKCKFGFDAIRKMAGVIERPVLGVSNTANLSSMV